MSTHVVGFVQPDERFKVMMAIYGTCKMAGVSIPPEVEKFFGGGEPDPTAFQVSLPVQEWKNPEGTQEGYELRVKDIPAHVSVIRFYNAW